MGAKTIGSTRGEEGRKRHKTCSCLASSRNGEGAESQVGNSFRTTVPYGEIPTCFRMRNYPTLTLDMRDPKRNATPRATPNKPGSANRSRASRGSAA